MPRKKKSDIPRFALTLTDTHTLMEGPDGKAYFSMTVGTETLAKLMKPTGKGASSDFESFLVHFQTQVDTLNGVYDSDSNEDSTNGIS